MDIRALTYIAAALLFLAIFPWPYGYYILLRWLICFSASVVAWGFYKSHLSHWSLIFGGIAFLFNPLIPVYLTKPVWVSIDLIVSVLFVIASQSSGRQPVRKD